jgi:hypothetical protein
MKNLTSVLFASVLIILASCSKQANQPPAPEKMNGIEFTKKYGVKLPFLDYSDGATERGRKPKASEANIAVWANDLTLEPGLTTTVSPNAQWVAIQKFIDSTSVDGAYCPTGCNGYYNTPPGTGVTFSCNGDGAGFYRSFTSDFPIVDANGDRVYVVHVSSFLPQ